MATKSKGVGRGWHGNGPGMGEGWGGAAKGPGKDPGNGSPKAPAFTAGNKANEANPTNGQADPIRLRNREEWLGVYQEVAFNPAQPGSARVMAVDKYFDRTEGKSVDRSVIVNVDDLSELSDDALTRREAELEAKLASGSSGTISPSRPIGPNRVVN